MGIDPVLRQNIWDHLVKITKDGMRTIIITTHYIEETRQASIIGLMRGGKFLAEESPTRLMEMHHMDTLEGVFLKLSRRQNMGLRRRSSILSSVTGVPPDVDVDDEMSGEFGDNVSISSRRRSIAVAVTSDDDHIPELPPEEKGRSNFKMLNPQHMKALIWKNFLWMWRNVGMMLFIIGLPVLQIIIFCLSIGKDPVGLSVAVVNFELNKSTDLCLSTIGCDRRMLSCRYLKHLKRRKVEFINYDDVDDARYAVKKGWAWAAVNFPHNYTDSLIERLENSNSVDEFTAETANMFVVMDMSSKLINFLICYSGIDNYLKKNFLDQQIGQLLQRDFLYSFQDFAKDVMVACNFSEKLASIPMDVSI